MVGTLGLPGVVKVGTVPGVVASDVPGSVVATEVGGSGSVGVEIVVGVKTVVS